MAGVAHTFKVVVIGDSGVGKSAFIERHRNGDFAREHVSTMGVEVHPLTFHTNRGRIILKMWDCAGKREFEGLGEDYYTGAHAALIMFDLSRTSTQESIATWKKKFAGVCGAGCPIVICGTKCDLMENPLMCGECCISSLDRHNIKEPILKLLQALVDPTIEFL
jgi:GTP-binding nuclear protein Ran